MNIPLFRLENGWEPVDGDACGRFILNLINLSEAPLSGFKLAYTSLTRIKDSEVPRCDNAVFLRRNANFHQFAPADDFVLLPGESWRFTVAPLWRPARHRTDGAKSAYVTLSDGSHVPVSVDDTLLSGRPPEPAPVLMPKGEVTQPFSLLPWPAFLQTVRSVSGAGRALSGRRHSACPQTGDAANRRAMKPFMSREQAGWALCRRCIPTPMKQLVNSHLNSPLACEACRPASGLMHFLNRDYFNHLVFPRLGAIAEAGWTPKDSKNWLRFAAISPLMPKL